jgi:hypothetical protein
MNCRGRFAGCFVAFVVLAPLACGGGTAEEKTKTAPTLASASATSSPIATPAVDRAKEIRQLASEAFEFGYSPLFMERQERTMTTNVRLPLGTFAHASKLPRAEDSDVLPSLDTLLSSAWVEVGESGAYTLKLPDMADRWFAIQMFDAYAEPIGVVGKKTTGTKAQQIVITGPNFSGTIPANATQIKSTTSTVWLLGRTHVTSDSDVTKASALLKQWTLTPLPPTAAPKDLPPPPLGRPQDLKFGGPEMFDELGDILKNQPPPVDVTGALVPPKYHSLADFAKAGIGPGLTPNKTLPQEELASLSQGIKDGAEQIDQALEQLAKRKNGWDLDATFGQRGVDPTRQAASVLRGLDWPFASEALVYIARVDDGDRVLSGAHDYALHLDKSSLPPAKAFWSISMYSARTATLVPGAKRAVLTDQTAKKSGDGSIDLTFAADAPAKNESNWLPAPKGEAFIVVLRVYEPSDGASSWSAPVVKRLK